MRIKIDTHIHTFVSEDSSNSIEDLLKAMEEKNIDKLFITDHNSTESALKLSSLYPEKFIAGEEIKTIDGEIIVYFIKSFIPPKLSLFKTIELAKDQNCFICVPHPLDRLRNSAIGFKNLIKIVDLIDGIEVFNSRCLFKSDNEKAKDIAIKYNLFQIAGSDAHVKSEIGTSGLIIEDFNNINSFKKNLNNSEIFGKLSSPFIHLNSSFIKLKKKFK